MGGQRLGIEFNWVGDASSTQQVTNATAWALHPDGGAAADFAIAPWSSGLAKYASQQSAAEGVLMVSGSGDIPPLRPGGARRAIVPQVLGYGTEKGFFSSGAPTEIRNLQPVPPPYVWTDGNGDKVDAYLRFKNMYLNENRLDQPDLILDVILRAPPANAAELLESAPPPTVSTSPFGLVEP